MNKKLWIFSSFLLTIFVLAACGSANLDLVEEQSINLNIGDTYSLTLQEGVSLTFETENSGIATVNSSGVVTAVSEGVTTIIASNGSETDAILVNVFLSFEENPVVNLEYSNTNEIIIVYEDGTRVNTGLIASNQDGSNGAPGSDGEDGVSISSALVSGGALFVTLTDGTVLEAGDVVGPTGSTGARGPIGPIGPQGVSIDSVTLENDSGVDYLVFGFDNNTEEKVNFSAFLAGSVEFQSLELNQLSTIVSNSLKLAQQIETNSIFGFNPFLWNQEITNLINPNNDIINHLLATINSSSLYEREYSASTSAYTDYQFSSRFDILEAILAALVFAHYYEISERLENENLISQTIQLYLDEVYGLYYDDVMDQDAYFDLHNIIGLLMGLKFVGEGGTAGLDNIKYVNNEISNRIQNSYVQYLLNNPLTGWSVNSITDLRQYITLSTRNLLTVDVKIIVDPKTEHTFEIINNDNSRYLDTDGAYISPGYSSNPNYFPSSRWQEGGIYGFNTGENLANRNGLTFENLQFSFGPFEPDYYFGTTNLNPGSYDLTTGTTDLVFEFEVNYGQVFPMPSEVNFRGMVLGATAQVSDTSTYNFPVSSIYEDEGIHSLDYVVYNANGKTFRLNTYFFDIFGNDDHVPLCYGVNTNNLSIDDTIGIPHGNQTYYDIGCDHAVTTAGVITNITMAFVNINQGMTPDSFSETARNSNNQNVSPTTIYTYSWPESRQYITFNRIYNELGFLTNSNLYNDAELSEIVIKADWVQVHQVQFTVSGAVVRNEFVDQGDSATAPDITSSTVTSLIPSGYEFVPGSPWSQAFNNITDDLEVQANLQLITYNINYENLDPSASQSAASTPSPSTFNVSDLPVALNNPSVTGYTFIGWYTQSTGGTLVTQVAVAGDITLYARWTKNEQIITFDANYSGGTNATQSALSDTNTPLDSINVLGISRPGYTFSGWTFDANGTSPGTPIGDQGSVLVTTTGLTLYAQWEADDRTITFDTNGGDTNNTTQSTKSDTSVTLAAFTGTYAGYTFLGWSTSPTGTTVDFNDQATNFAVGVTDITLYAVWSADPQVIYFDANGGTGSGSQSGAGVTTDADVNLTTLSSLGITRAGFTFQGWNTQPDGTGTSYVDGISFIVPTDNITLYAIWGPITYDVLTSINAGGNTYQISVSSSNNSGTPFSIGEIITVTITGENITVTNARFGPDSNNTQSITLSSSNESTTGSIDTWTITFTLPAEDVTFFATISADPQ